ncbi:MAG: PepSY domain-containing protein [Chthonomonadales bacterium]
MTRLGYALSLAAFGISLAVPGSMALAQKPRHAPHVRVTASQAKSIALKKVNGQVVGNVQLENEAGKWEYAVSVRQGKILREVMVNAQSGKIESVETTTAAEEAAEARAEKAAKHQKNHESSKNHHSAKGGEEHGERD